MSEMFFLSLASLLSVSCVSAQFHSDLSLDAYTRAQTEAALRGISANTYAAGSDYAGLIIASPATDTARAGETGGQVRARFWKPYHCSSLLTMEGLLLFMDSRCCLDNENRHQSVCIRRLRAGRLHQSLY